MAKTTSKAASASCCCSPVIQTPSASACCQTTDDASFDPTCWHRVELSGVPIYVRADSPSWFVPNQAGDRILTTLMQGQGVDGDVTAARFLARLPAGGDGGYPGRAALLQTDRLRELWFHITNRCNLQCTHCLFSSSPHNGQELSAERVLDLADQAWRLGCRVFALTGGEPFVHRGFERIVDGLLAFDGTHVAVLTNGTQVRRHAEALRRWGPRRFHLQISVDGLQANHDRIRGAGTFDRLRENVTWLRDQHIPFTMSMCVERGNVHEMPHVVDFAAETGAGNVHFMWYFVRGRADASGFALPQQIAERLIESAQRAEKQGIGVDNIAALRSQVFAPTGTIHDGSSAGWESLAMGPDGKLYPSPALVGVAELGTDLGDDLARAWRDSAVLNRLRAGSAKDLRSPWRFILGGGDSDHSLMHGGTFVGHDPYEAVYEKIATWLISREASNQGDDGPPRLRLKMGDMLETCAAHGAVALVHTNCLLALTAEDSRRSVKDFYTDAAEDTKQDIVNPICYPSEVIAHIPEAFRFRGYGCGSPVLDAEPASGQCVVDLGSGTGIECFIASKRVGKTGRVVGVDMLDSMLEKAQQGAAAVTQRLEYANIEFKKGYLENLPLDDASADVVLSNCVINLSVNKRRVFSEIFRILREGGKLVVSDVVCETDPHAAIRNDETLRGECIAGTLTQRDLFGLLDESGFVAAKVIKRFPYRVVRGHRFFSMTFEVHKPAASDLVAVMYRGPFASIVTHRGTVLTPGVTRRIRRDEAAGCDGALFVFDDHGAVLNTDSPASSCCGGPEADE